MSKYYDLRKNYEGAPLRRRDLEPSPFRQFDQWFKTALEKQVPEPNAMVLSTVNQKHCPSSRMLLLKEYDERGFIFFSNYHSQKALELEKNNQACMLIWWQPLRRQVRITGRVIKAPESVSDAYFASREKASNIGAVASSQSSVLKNRAELVERCEAVKKQFEKSENIPRPEYWGGYILIPDEFEFWQGALDRLHDRFVYRKEANDWIIERLSP